VLGCLVDSGACLRVDGLIELVFLIVLRFCSPAGTYQPLAVGNGVTSCLTCPAGSYSRYSAQSSCVKCAAGRFTSSTGVSKQVPVVPRIRNVNTSTFQIFAQSADENGRAGLSSVSVTRRSFAVLLILWCV
jgi:hypothetical protein